MKKILFMNAAPTAGKDTVAKYIVGKRPDVQHIKFARVLKERTHAAYGLTVPWDHYEGPQKDLPQPEFLGLTPRQAYINFSELLMKPVHGVGVWAQLLLEEVKASPHRNFVVSDLGFQIEWETFIHYKDIYAGLVRLYRGTCDYSNDSREYVAVRGPWKYIVGDKAWQDNFNKHILNNCWEVENNGNDFVALYTEVDKITGKFFA